MPNITAIKVPQMNKLLIKFWIITRGWMSSLTYIGKTKKILFLKDYCKKSRAGIFKRNTLRHYLFDSHVHKVLVGEEVIGFCTEIGDKIIGLSALNSGLFIFLDNTEIPLNDDNVKIEYQHNLQNSETYFSIVNKDKKWEFTYRAWWAGDESYKKYLLGHPQPEVFVQDDFDNDLGGMIFLLKLRKEMRDSYWEVWRSRMA